MEKAFQNLHLINNIYALLSLIVLVGGFLAYKYGQKIIDLISHKSEQKPISQLQYHDMFTTAHSVRGKVHTITFTTHGKPDPIKTKLIHKLIDLKIDHVTKSFKEFLREEELEKIDGNKLKYNILKVLSVLVQGYNEQAFHVFVKEFGISEEDAKYLIDCYETFRQDIVEGFVSRLESITTNEDYTTNYEKISAVLEVIAISLYIIPKDAKNAMDLANGRFIKYAS